jgi:hypothetical protein
MSEFLNLAVAAHGGLDDGQAKDRAFEASKVLRWGQSLACYCAHRLNQGIIKSR